VEPLKVGNVIHIEPHVPNAKQNMELSFEVAINEPNPHHSRRWNAEEFFVRLQQRCDKGKTWLDGETDSKVLSEVHDQISTRSETPRVRA
jgi:hypothetical protein